MTKIGLDISGGDFGPEVRIEGVVDAMELENDLEMFLYGNKKLIEEILDEYTLATETLDRIEIVNSKDDISMATKDINAVKNNREASMSLLLEDLVLNEEGESIIDAGITAGNTGVGVIGAKRKIKTLNVGGIRFGQALAAFIPKKNGGETLMLDFGATVMGNNEKKIIKAYLNNALMAVSYLKSTGIENPKIGLINIGEEESKGSKEIQEVYKKLKELFGDIFIGNIEGDNLLNTEADILLTDAVTGNNMLKTAKGIGRNIKEDFKELFENDLLLKVVYFFKKIKFKNLFKKYESKETGAALCLGLKNSFYITHGSSDPKLIKHAILRAYEYSNNGIRKKMREELENLVINLPEELKKEVWNK
ncbi:MAG: hypothetical protein QM490_00510 [Candidatus Gracilibacteria bacterium]